MHDHEVIPAEVMKRALEKMEGQEVPLKDRPGGKTIGMAKVHNGEFTLTVGDPAWKKVFEADAQTMNPPFSIGMSEKSRKKES